MESSKVIRLGSIGYELGESLPLTSLEDIKKDGLEKVIGSNQFMNYLDAGKMSAYELASSSIEQTLSKSNIPGSEVDMIVIATDSFTSVDENHRFYTSLSESHGINNAYPIIVTMSECANFHVALEVAQTSIATNKARNVLVVTTDKSSLVSPRSRIVGDGIGVMSDGAASCLLSTDLDDGLELLQVERIIRAELLSDKIDPQQELVVRVEANKDIFNPLFSKHNIDPTSISKLFASNVNVDVLALFMNECGITSDKIFQENHKRLAHCLACDCLINLSDYTHSYGIQGNEVFAMLGVGPITWGGALLRSNYELESI